MALPENSGTRTPRTLKRGADTVIDFGGGDLLTLENVNLGNLDADDFLFG